MICRDGDNGWILISQVDHAHLAADVAGAWGNDAVPPLPEPAELVPAIRDHDEGWRDWERTPDLHPGTHQPRNFTEMPPADSIRIWTQSIETCRRGRQSIVATVDEFRRFLELEGLRFTHERAIVAEEVFSSREAFHVDELYQRLPQRDDGRKISRATMFRTLGHIERAGLLKKVSLGTYRDAYEQTRRLGEGSPLAGIWVSKHFTALAERSLAHHPGEEQQPLKTFLDRQHQSQAYWAADIARDRGQIAAPELIETGFRLIQFFDAISLWLCCHPRTSTESFELPGGELMHFTPLPSGEIAVEPFPFNVPSLGLEVTGKKLARKEFANTEEFQLAFDQAPRERLVWQLVRW